MYTQGEWVVSNSQHGTFKLIECIQYDRYDKGEVELPSIIVGTADNIDEMENNAKLISAAPNLYEVCKEISGNVDMMTLLPVHTVSRLMKAIRKAEC